MKQNLEYLYSESASEKFIYAMYNILKNEKELKNEKNIGLII